MHVCYYIYVPHSLSFSLTVKLAVSTAIQKGLAWSLVSLPSVMPLNKTITKITNCLF